MRWGGQGSRGPSCFQQEWDMSGTSTAVLGKPRADARLHAVLGTASTVQHDLRGSSGALVPSSRAFPWNNLVWQRDVSTTKVYLLQGGGSSSAGLRLAPSPQPELRFLQSNKPHGASGHPQSTPQGSGAARAARLHLLMESPLGTPKSKVWPKRLHPDTTGCREQRGVSGSTRPKQPEGAAIASSRRCVLKPACHNKT